MYNATPYEFAPEQTLYIDVRSESEYKTGHIVNAINLPILYDLERHEVGWIYKNTSVEEAKRVGLKYGSEKLHIFYDTLFELRNQHPDKKIVFYCARGGYRSRSIALLMQSIDIQVYWLQGGYKAYRNEVLNKINQSEADFPHFIVLNGFTGVGKTHLLHQLSLLGEPVLDLEGAANHKGSNLGAIGTDEYQSAQNFENSIYDQLMRVHHKYCFVESESRRIGKVLVPKLLFNKIQLGSFIQITASMDFRISGLMADYVYADNFDAGIQSGLEKIKPFISPSIYTKLVTAYTEKQYETFTEIILKEHYDPLYKKSIESHTHVQNFEVSDYVQCSQTIIDWVNSFLTQLE